MFLLLLRCLFAYVQLLLTRKSKRSVLLIPSFDSFGGTRTYFIGLIKFLSRKQYQITVMLSPTKVDEEILALQGSYPFTIQPLLFDVWRTNFNRPLLSRLNRNFLRYQLQELVYFWSAIRQARSALLICSVSNPEELLFLFLSPIKLIYVLHTATMDRLDAIKRWLLRFRLGQKRRIIAVSHFAKDLLLQNWTRGKGAGYVDVVYNYYEPGKKVRPNEPGKEGNCVLTLGSVVAYKNPLFWIEVCKKVNSKRAEPLTFIWAGNGEMLDECKAIVQNSNQIRFVGYHENVEELYEQCLIYFQPSFYESHGISVIGAMYYGKPCIVSDRGGLPESVKDNESGFIVDIENDEEAASAISTLVQDKQLCKEMGQKGKERFDRLFTRDIWESEMISILRQ